MTQSVLHAVLNDGRRLRFRIEDEHLGAAIALQDFESVKRLLVVAARRHGWEISVHDVSKIQVETIERAPSPHPINEHAPPKGCRAALGLAHRALPARLRDDTLDEWLDEIECAAAAGRPVVRRTASIIVRALPRMTLRSRMPVRARGKGG